MYQHLAESNGDENARASQDTVSLRNHGAYTICSFGLRVPRITTVHKKDILCHQGQCYATQREWPILKYHNVTEKGGVWERLGTSQNGTHHGALLNHDVEAFVAERQVQHVCFGSFHTWHDEELGELVQCMMAGEFHQQRKEQLKTWQINEPLPHALHGDFGQISARDVLDAISVQVLAQPRGPRANLQHL
jgi:hypothetical protein